jgi:hypothetical protein
MTKRLGVATTAAALLALAAAGPAGAQVGNTCPANASSGQTPPPTGGIKLGQGDGLVGTLYADAATQRVGGELDNPSALANSFGEADVDVVGTDVKYSGETNSDSTNDNSTLGYGEIQNGSVGTSGVSGSADGSTAGGALQGEGSLSGTTLTFRAETPAGCVG